MRWPGNARFGSLQVLQAVAAGHASPAQLLQMPRPTPTRSRLARFSLEWAVPGLGQPGITALSNAAVLPPPPQFALMQGVASAARPEGAEVLARKARLEGRRCR